MFATAAMPLRKRALPTPDPRERVLTDLARDAVLALQTRHPRSSSPVPPTPAEEHEPMSPASFLRRLGLESCDSDEDETQNEGQRGQSDCVRRHAPEPRILQVLQSKTVPMLVQRAPLLWAHAAIKRRAEPLPFNMSQVDDDDDDNEYSRFGENDENVNINVSRSAKRSPKDRECATPDQAAVKKVRRSRHADDFAPVTPATAQAAHSLLALMR
jgi:hypothetical protein